MSGTAECECQYCGKSFSVHRSVAESGRKFCSWECYSRARGERVLCCCEECGKEFELLPSDLWGGRGKFCSWECFNRSRVQRVLCRCQECGKEYETIPSKIERGSKYCSAACSKKATGRSRRREKNVRTCENCGREFEASSSPARVSSGRGKFCSKACFNEARRDRVERICEYCGKTFEVKRSLAGGGRGRYCSSDCSNKVRQRREAFTCIVCGKEFELVQSRVDDGRGRFCSKACSLRYAGETSIEQMVREELERRGEPFEQEMQFGRYYVDFVLPRRKAVIECDGTYWHTRTEVMERDRRKDDLLAFLGYRVFRFTEEEIRASAQRCVDVVLASG